MIRFVASALLLSPCAFGQSFQYTDFSSTAGLVLNAQAASVTGKLRVSPASGSAKGSAWYDTQVLVEGGFDTTFEFEITSQGAGGADGFTFIIHNDARGTSFLSDHGSAMGYSAFDGSAAGTELSNALVLEFDTWSSGPAGTVQTNDISASEMSEHTGGTGPVFHTEGMSLGQIDTAGSLGIDLSDGFPHTVRVFYVPGQLDVFLDGMLALTMPYRFSTGGTWVNPDFGGVPAHMAGDSVGGLMLTAGTAWIGFTAGAGGAWENHDINSWSFSSGASAFGVCNGDGGNQIGCTPCPCLNEAPAGTAGGCLNSMATSAALKRAGSSSVTSSDLRFEAEGVVPGRACHLFSGNLLAPLNPANPCFGADSGVRSIAFDGMRCVVQGIMRHGVRMSDMTGEVGTINTAWGAPDPFANFSGFTAGSTRIFQMIYSDDPLVMCQTGRNSTQAIAVSMTP